MPVFARTGLSERRGPRRAVGMFVLSLVAVALLSNCSTRPSDAGEEIDPLDDQDAGVIVDGLAEKDTGKDDAGGGIGLPDIPAATDSGPVDSGTTAVDTGQVVDAGVDGGVDDAGAVVVDAEASDAAVDDAADGADGPETTATADGFDNDAFGTSCPGGSGCPCTKHNECNIGLCVLNGTQRACAKPCFAGGKQCDITETCKDVQLTDALVTVCVAADRQACDPCTTDSQCVGAGGQAAKSNKCVLHGLSFGSFCGVACAKTTDCAKGFVCESTISVEGGFSKQCVPAVSGGSWPGTCSCTAHGLANKLTTNCTNNALDKDGKKISCTGKRTCQVGAISLCTAPTTITDEVCDGIDNDCDGNLDEHTCKDDDPCTLDACDGVKGKCVFVAAGKSCCKEAKDCDDGKCATIDFCTSANACEHKPAPAECAKASDCDDGDPCTTDLCGGPDGCGQCENKPGAKCCKTGKDCPGSGVCAAAVCDKGKCAVQVEKDGNICDDGNACTTKTTCQKGSCVPPGGKAPVCDDGNPCTNDTCDPTGAQGGKDGCLYVNNTSPCSDGDACTVGDVCGGGKCKLGVAKVCADGNICTKDACDAAKGCVYPPGAATTCDDGNPCTKGDSCKDGKCAGGQGDCKCKSDADCAKLDDNDKCNGTLTCDAAGKCVISSGSKVVCDKTGCNKSSCIKATGECVIDNDVGGSKCDDNNKCTTKDACGLDPGGSGKGTCKGGPATNCNDGNPCTKDSCKPADGCKHNNQPGMVCDDNDACSTGTTCIAGVCAGGQKKSCDDGNPCTKDSCDLKTAKCINDALAVGATCDDGDKCTSGDVCSGGKCKPAKLIDCDDGNACTIDSCAAATGKCGHNNKNDGLKCGVNGKCVSGKCVLDKGCKGKQDGATCDDGNPCTANDSCLGGGCAGGTNKVCDDSDPCTKDFCDITNGKCAAKAGADSKPCDDGNQCSVGDACKGGKCAGGGAKSCDDANGCTSDACDQLKGCTHIPVQAGSKCDDNNKCTSNDFCQAAACKPGKWICPGNCGDNVCSQGENCGICKQDCGVCLGDAEVHFSVSATGPGLLAGTSVDRNNGTYDQTLAALAKEPPGTNGRVTAQSGPLSAIADFRARKEPIDSLRGIVRTHEVWHDQRIVRALARVRDAKGRPQVASSSVTLRLQKTGQKDVTASCSPNANGICDVAASVPASWFVLGKSGKATAWLEAPNLPPNGSTVVTLHGTPLFSAAPANGVELTIPLGPRLPGTSFVVPVYAYTTGQPLESFDVELAYDPKVVSIDAVNTSSLYDAQKNVKNNQILLVGVRKNGVANTKVTGKVLLANLTVRMKSGANPGTKGAMSGTIRGMFNVQNVPLVTKGTAARVRGPKGTAESGEVVVAANPIRGVYAYTTKAEAFNTSILDGKTLRYPIIAKQARTVGPDKTVTASCKSPDGTVVTTDPSCRWVLDGNESKGAKIFINVTAGLESTSVPVTVWHPQFFKLTASDKTLSPVTGWFADCKTKAPRFQRADVLVEATFKSAGTTITARVDEYVTVESDDTKVVNVVNAPIGKGKRLVGLKPGTATISASGKLKQLAKVDVTVDNNAVKVEDLAVVAATGMKASVTPIPATALAIGKATKANAALEQKLFAEFATADVLAWAKLSDKTRMAIDLATGVTIDSLDDAVIEAHTKKLLVTAVGSGEGKLLRARWKVCDKALATGLADIFVKLPPPKSAELKVQQPRISWQPSDQAATAGVANDSGLSVVLKYGDGSSKDVTLDKRTLYDDKTGDPSDLFEVKVTKGKDGSPIKVRVIPTGKGVGKAALTVGFKQAKSIVVKATVNIVKHEKFTIDAHPLPTFPGSHNVSKTTISPIAKTDTWQRIRMDLRSVLTDGHVIDVSTRGQTSFASYESGTFKLNGKTGTGKSNSQTLSFSGRDVSVISPNDGKQRKVDVVGSFDQAMSGPLTVTVSNKAVLVKSLKTTFPGTFLGIKTLPGQANGGAAQMKVQATFEDGTVFTNALSLPKLLTFSSSHPKVVSIDAKTGLARLHDNHNRLVTLTATARQSKVKGSSKTAPNLLPDVGDVDLGNTSGVAHPDVKPGQKFVMPVRVNTGGKPIGAVDTTITYDKDVIAAVSGKTGKHWPGGQFEITVNDPPGKVHLVAAAKVGTKRAGSQLEIAVLTFTGIKKGSKTETPIGGFITKLLDNNKPQTAIGAELKPGQTRTIVAGAGVKDPECANGKKPSDFRGNANGNCEFEVGDVSYTLQYLAQLITDAELQPFQKKELDADGNGVIEVRDAVYLLRVLAGKFRFATVAASSPGNLAGTLRITAKLGDKLENPSMKQNKVYFEVGFKLNDQVKWTVGKKLASSKATKFGAVVEAVHYGGGLYEAKATGFTKNEKNVGVAIIIKTTDVSGAGSPDRAVALHGSPWLSELAKFVPIAKFDMPRPTCKAVFDCNDGDACTVEDCNTTTQKCSYKPLGCDDVNPCTQDSCDPKSGCKYKVLSNTEQPCYTGKKGTKDVGNCKGGKLTCNKDGSAGKCLGEVVPVYKEQCDAKDDDCDGTTDEGCAATGFSGGFGSGVLDGQAGNRGATGSLGAGWTSGTVSGGTYRVEIGLYDYLANWFAKVN